MALDGPAGGVAAGLLFLVKPFSRSDLLRKIQEILGGDNSS